jgi:hypothetical protein
MRDVAMKVWKAFALCALAAPTAACTVQPAFPVAAVRVPSPVVVAPAPIAVVPAAPFVAAPVYKPHPGRGWKRGHW